jgi:hypothetical protein
MRKMALMGGLIICASLDGYGDAARHMAGASGRVPDISLPSLGDAGAESSMGHFARTISGYHAGLCEAATHGAVALDHYVVNFGRAGA